MSELAQAITVLFVILANLCCCHNLSSAGRGDFPFRGRPEPRQEPDDVGREFHDVFSRPHRPDPHHGHRPRFPPRQPGEPIPAIPDPAMEVEPLSLSADGCRCGVSTQSSSIFDTRIVGGVAALVNEFPWQVGLIRTEESRPFCGGSLLSSRTVLTAGHCLVDIATFYVIVGSHDLSQEQGATRYSPMLFERHPQFNERTDDYDFAIITLGEQVNFTQAVSPICLTSRDNDDNRLAVVSGWGTTSPGGTQPDILQKAIVRTMSNAECSSLPSLYKPGDITDRMICASAENVDSCQGDSGGPLAVQAGENMEQIGIVSFGAGCARANAPGVYARLSAGKTWIQSRIRGVTCPH